MARSAARTGASPAMVGVGGATPRVIGFVGIDGSGKTTQCAELADWLRGRGLVVQTPEQPNLEPLRAALDDACRAGGGCGYLDHLGPDVARLALTTPKWVALWSTYSQLRDDVDVVLFDRTASCYIALAVTDACEDVDLLRALFSTLPVPDLTLRMVVSPRAAHSRIAARGLDSEDMHFLDTFDRAYRELPEAAGFIGIDGEHDVASVTREVRRAVVARFPELR